MGSAPSNRRHSLRRTLSSLSSTKKTRIDNTRARVQNELIESNSDSQTRSEKTQRISETPSSDTERTIILSTGQRDKRGDELTQKSIENLVMLRYTVKCKNEQTDPIDLVVMEGDNEASSAVRGKLLPGERTSFDVLVFKKPVDGKVYLQL
jgi:hypothetical protein